MKTVTAVIHNADHTSVSDGMLYELSRSGVTEGNIITGVVNWNNKSISFSGPTGDHCISYIDHTCTILQPITQSDIVEGNIVHKGGDISTPYVITKVGFIDVELKRVSTLKELRKEITVKRADILTKYFWLGRMTFEEFDDY